MSTPRRRMRPTRAFSTTLVAALLSLASGPADAVERSSKNSIYAEGLGPGLAYSLNYDRLVLDDLAVRIGASYMSFSATASSGAGKSSASSTFMTFPLTASYLGIGSGSHSLELGGGMTMIYSSGSASAVGAKASGSGMMPVGNLLVGWRVQPVAGGFQFRLGFTGIFGKGMGLDVKDPTAVGMLPWGYISFGGTF